MGNKKLPNLVFPTYQKVRQKIDKKAGSKPPLPKDLPKGKWSEQSLKVLEERYLFRDDQNKITETPEDLCWRVAWEVASAEAVWGANRKLITEKARDFYRLLISHQFLPNSPTLMNAGTKNGLQYSGCFVVPVDDSLVGIFDAIKYQALIHQTGGGTGFSFSRLRARGSIVKSSRGVASGPVSFMRVFDSATNEIKQGGKRRGANMGILRVDHPDIREFIHCKEEGGITNFNISVGVTDAFMKAYKEDGEYKLVNPKNNEVTGKLKAREIFEEIAQNAWRTGDPGLIFLDRVNSGPSNPVPSLGPIESTNPCGEQPLYPFDSCNLGSIFLNYFVKEENGKREFDWEKLKEVTGEAVRFLDNVIEVNPFTLEEIRQTTLSIRRIGLGVGGWADLLIALRIPYDSQEALDLAEMIMKTVQETAVKTSESLAKVRGPFPLWSESIYKNNKPRRNSTVTTIAPTGSISIIANASSGIEPLFAIAYRHIVKDEHLHREMTFINPEFIKVAMDQGFWSKEVEEEVNKLGILNHSPLIPEEVRKVFVTAHEIDPVWHIRTQMAFQKYTENAVSKTINLKHDAKAEEVKQAYLLAWDLGCKGITIFRDGSKETQVLNLGLKNKEEKGDGVIPGESLLTRPFVVSGSTYRLVTPVGNAFITINEDESHMPLELFINVGKAGSDVQAMAEALGRTISTSLRLRSSLNPRERAREIAEQLSGIGGRRSVGFGPNKIRSLPDAISVALSQHYHFNVNGNGHSEIEATPGMTGATLAASFPAPNGVVKSDPLAASVIPAVAAKEKMGDLCPSCGSGSLVYEEGCSKCHACGYSEC
jgi:ribonucleoside-diphosphate reductase alpha chain